MSRNLLSLLIIGTLALSTRATLAADQNVGSGVGGKGYATSVTATPGRTTDDGLAHPGMAAHIPGQIGVTGGGASTIGSGGTNRSTDDGFHSAGIGKIKTAGTGGNTNDIVPGRSINYVPISGGKGLEASVSGRGY